MADNVENRKIVLNEVVQIETLL